MTEAQSKLAAFAAVVTKHYLPLRAKHGQFITRAEDDRIRNEARLAAIREIKAQ